MDYEDYLEHTGKKGMKWGHRKAPQPTSGRPSAGGVAQRPKKIPINDDGKLAIAMMAGPQGMRIHNSTARKLSTGQLHINDVLKTERNKNLRDIGIITATAALGIGATLLTAH